MSEFKDPDALAAILAASDPALTDAPAGRTKADQVEAAFGEWLEANGGDDLRVNWSTYQSVDNDGKAVTLDGRFSVEALRELLRLIDEAWKE